MLHCEIGTKTKRKAKLTCDVVDLGGVAGWPTAGEGRQEMEVAAVRSWDGDGGRARGERGCIIRATTSDMRKWGSRRQAAWGRIWWPRHRGAESSGPKLAPAGFEEAGRRWASRGRPSPLLPRRLTAARAHGSSAVSRAWIGDWRWDLRPERRKWAIDGVNGRESRSQQRADGHYKLSPRQFFWLRARCLLPNNLGPCLFYQKFNWIHVKFITLKMSLQFEILDRCH